MLSQKSGGAWTSSLVALAPGWSFVGMTKAGLQAREEVAMMTEAAGHCCRVTMKWPCGAQPSAPPAWLSDPRAPQSPMPWWPWGLGPLRRAPLPCTLSKARGLGWAVAQGMCPQAGDTGGGVTSGSPCEIINGSPRGQEVPQVLLPPRGAPALSCATQGRCVLEDLPLLGFPTLMLSLLKQHLQGHNRS